MFSDEKWTEIAEGMTRHFGTPTSVDDVKAFAATFDNLPMSEPPVGHYVDRQGNKLTLGEYECYRYGDIHVGHDRIPDADILVSTIWVGNAWMGWVFETMVFVGGSTDDRATEKYRTEAEAVAGHDQKVAEWKAKVAAR